jgi:cobalt-zinc-cadmium efflux system membrane fusion protein
VETTRAALNQLQQLYKRRKSLFDEGAIPQRDLLQTQTDLATAQANYDVAQRSYDLLVNQLRGRDEQIARANLEQAQARLQGAAAQLQFTEIRTPFAGTITDQFQYPGDMAQPTTPMFTVADLSSVTARAQVPEAEAGKAKVGQVCSFTPVDQDRSEIKGKVTVVNRAVDMARRTVEVWCEVPRPPVWVRAGMFGTATIYTGEVRNAVLVPQTALVQEEAGTMNGTVFVIDGKKIAHKREVVVGEILGDQARIASGLKAGETIVVEGAYGLPDNAQVTLKGESK